MIHTIQLQTKVSHEQLEFLCERHSTTVGLLHTISDRRFNGISTSFIKKCFGYQMYVYVDIIKLLDGKADIDESDYQRVRDKLIEYKSNLVGDIMELDLILIRIDYRFDIRIESAVEKRLLFQLYSKLSEKVGRKVKNDAYDTTVYFQNKSMVIIVYDKQIERRDRRKEDDIQSYEENVLRLEVRLLNKRLNYNKRWGMEKSLESYFKKDVWSEYMSGQACPIFFTGDYYKIFRVDTILDNSELKEKERKRLREFLCDISKEGMDAVKTMKFTDNKGKCKLKYSPAIRRKCLRQLENLQINPILIPKNLEIESYIPNRLIQELMKQFPQKFIQTPNVRTPIE